MLRLALLILAFASPAFAQSYPPQIAAELRKSLSCPAGRTANVAKFVLQGDFNGDGVTDYIFDENESPCPDMMMCGSAGCSSTAFVSGPSGFARVDIGNIHGATIVRGQKRDRLSLALHGSACGRVGAAGCRKEVEWNGRGFSPARAGSDSSRSAATGALAPPFGKWLIHDSLDQTCGTGMQSVTLSPTQIVVDWAGDETRFPVSAPSCKGDLCTFRGGGGRTWTTRRLPDGTLAFRGLHNFRNIERSVAAQGPAFRTCGPR